ncbi:ribosome biogenesis protein tsr3 [Phytophthora pseudosyringae]|uniref:Ribosome biogenesis protein tsr3 n=1 Tax=Phytophthora pseudosyringae TaxID=221518 RepID=A0A8T1V9Y9_9STRA|nr:ribosome biogenesis protein tsr3 [Phytophthora pseudosyringae]
MLVFRMTRSMGKLALQGKRGVVPRRPLFVLSGASMTGTKESKGGARDSPELSKYAEIPSSEYTLRIGVHRFRAIVGSLAMACALIGAMFPFASDGVRVGSFQSSDMDATAQKRLLDKYNSISGSLTVLLMKPLDVFLTMLVAVAFVCIATKYSVDHENRRRYVVTGIIGAVGYLLNSGFSALNMQVVSGKIHPRVIASDLVMETAYDDNQPLDAEGLLTTMWNASFRENSPGNSVLNTIMRNLFVPVEVVPTWCNQSFEYQYPFKNVMASYGFPARTWQQYAVSRALEPTASLSMPMNAVESDLPSDENLPMNLSTATNLVVYAMVVGNSFLGWWGVDDEAWSANTIVNVSAPLLMAEHFNLTTRLSANATFVGEARTLLVNYFNKAENASTADELAKVEFSHVDVSDNVMFDALTIEIPTQKYGGQKDNSSRTNPFYRSLYAYTCNPKACLMADAAEYKTNGSLATETTIYPRVQALAICLNDTGAEDLTTDFRYAKVDEVMQSCKQRSNWSMIVVSVGKRIEGDSFERSQDARIPTTAINARMVYSLTVGRLSWVSEDLANSFDAECASDSGCLGVRFPLERAKDSTTSEHLLVSSDSILMSSLSPINLNKYWFPVGASEWTALAATVEETRGAALETETKASLMVLPRNFKAVDPSLNAYTQGQDWWNCEILIDKHLNHMEKNHLYMEHTLQPAYTAGLYYIFQNGVVRQHLPLNVTDSPSQTSLEFDGNLQEMHIQASIPTTSMILAIVGCLVVGLSGIVIAALGKHGEEGLLEHGTAATAAEAIANRGKFPPFLLGLQLRDSATGDLAEISVDSLRVENVVLVHETDSSQQFIIGGR